jgi:hypothetical protein
MDKYVVTIIIQETVEATDPGHAMRMAEGWKGKLGDQPVKWIGATALHPGNPNPSHPLPPM